MNPKVSVCVVTYNHEKYIRQCLQSIVEQMIDFDLEVIVSDDCSSDQTRAIIAEFARDYPTLIKPVFLEKNGGAIKNFIQTHNRATGDFVCHCDGDDYFLPGKLQNQFNYMAAHDACSVSWHRMKIEQDQQFYYLGSPSAFLKNGIVDAGTLLRLGSVGAHSSIMYRRAARKTIDDSMKVIDFYYSLEYLQSGYGFFLNEVYGVYRKDLTGTAMTASRRGLIFTKKCMAIHSLEFVRKNRQFRRDALVGALINFAYDTAHFRSSAIQFMVLAKQSFGLFSIRDIVDALRFKSSLSKKVQLS